MSTMVICDWLQLGDLIKLLEWQKVSTHILNSCWAKYAQMGDFLK